jgi:hypothetical protein
MPAVPMPQPCGAAVRAPASSASWPALVMWSAWAWVSTVQTSFRPYSRRTARSRSICSSTGSMMSASRVN